ncbi:MULTISPECIES: tRNA lysidine(34) synthetase TilS [Vibrio]|uniref:tRNA lysidine(34) synthetase TilS n=1 Tax=Vibrio TaxID=662 RepID=UPI00097E1A23|nr:MULTISPECIES: tRNA lysidine(34) synthetase TilS [Vibrio]AXN03428.1 tRNA lysidine(34) synthetase TilS [Vibrio anguillarum]MBT2915326.1 tRNA lysidine(34) synthetase TilS [Vibrio anguillarum]MCS0352487.1 tRNA lysidine(34) synthetase TilS [Vibrio ordalii]OQQ12132.1 tRNA lysidine(34) synthetase TilS [Vibrio anguillarum]
MSELYSLFSHVINRHRLASSQLVLGFSGGMDSRVMLELLAQYRDETSCECCAVYVHHGLSQHADAWAKQCQRWAQHAAIPFFIERVQLDTASGESVESLARTARYQVLAKYINTDDLLLTGQHSDDQIETFLLALKRGSGPKGLSSMAQAMPFGAGKIVRPLLAATRVQIESFAVTQNLDWIEDESNQDTRFDRNFIRHHITPVLTQRWPHIHQAVARSATLCAQQQVLLEELLQEAIQEAKMPDGSLSITALSHRSELARYQLLRMWLAQLGEPMPTQEHLAMIWQQVASARIDANPRLKLGQSEIRRFDQKLYCIQTYQDISDWQAMIVPDQSLTLPDGLGNLTLSSHGASKRIALPDDCHQLSVTFNPEGLAACPVGRVGSRKLKKLFQEHGVPSWLRRRTPILMHRNQVVAIANLFVDRDFSGQDCELIWDK